MAIYKNGEIYAGEENAPTSAVTENKGKVVTDRLLEDYITIASDAASTLRAIKIIVESYKPSDDTKVVLIEQILNGYMGEE